MPYLYPLPGTRTMMEATVCLVLPIMAEEAGGTKTASMPA